MIIYFFIFILLLSFTVLILQAKDENKLKAVQELSDSFDLIVAHPQYQTFLDHAMRVFLKILQVFFYNIQTIPMVPSCVRLRKKNWKNDVKYDWICSTLKIICIFNLSHFEITI